MRTSGEGNHSSFVFDVRDTCVTFAKGPQLHYLSHGIFFMGKCKKNPLFICFRTLTLYNNLNACVLFVPAMLLNSEPSVVLTSEAARTTSFWAQMVVAGVFGFAIGYVTGLQIKVGSLHLQGIRVTRYK